MLLKGIFTEKQGKIKKKIFCKCLLWQHKNLTMNMYSDVPSSYNCLYYEPIAITMMYVYIQYIYVYMNWIYFIDRINFLSNCGAYYSYTDILHCMFLGFFYSGASPSAPCYLNSILKLSVNQFNIEFTYHLPPRGATSRTSVHKPDVFWFEDPLQDALRQIIVISPKFSQIDVRISEQLCDSNSIMSVSVPDLSEIKEIIFTVIWNRRVLE